MSETWRAGYEKAVIAYMLSGRSYLVREDASIYSWADYDGTRPMREHLSTCGIAADTITESQWDEFEDTEADASHHHGIDLTVTCYCGRYTNKTLRLNEPVSTMITNLMGFS